MWWCYYNCCCYCCCGGGSDFLECSNECMHHLVTLDLDLDWLPSCGGMQVSGRQWCKRFGSE